MQDWLHKGKYHIMFDVGQGRGGTGRAGGIFWYDFKRESGIDLSIKQIFGHTETPEPVINMVDFHNIVALDTTNNKEHIYLFDTQTEKPVVLPMPHKPFKRRKECQNAVDFLNDDGTCTDCGKESDKPGLYWGFADGAQFVVVQAETAREAWEKAVQYWCEGQTITPTGVLPLNAREISHKRNYKTDNIIWQTGPGSNDYFFDDLRKNKP